MKKVIGIPHNITESILGVITKKPKSIFRRKDSILVDCDAKDNSLGYKATITSKTNLRPKGKVISDVNNIDDFNDGDVVMINQNGEILFHFDSASPHNVLFVTGKCNHRCIMCPQPPVTEESDSFDRNLKILSLAPRNANEIGITGGEPTLVGDRLFDYLRQINKRMPNTAINILSNGVRFAEKIYASKLAACKCKDLQIDIPLFSDIPSLHNEIVGAPTFYKTIQGLYNLALFKINVGIRIVIHKKTYQRLPQLAEFIYRNFPFVCQVAFLEMETTGLAEDNIESLWIDPYDYNKELSEAVSILFQRGLLPLIYNSQLCVLAPELHEFATKSISDWKDAYLEECNDCKLKKDCGGLFESNRKYHSSHIKPIPKFIPMPKPRDGNITISKFIEDNLTDSILANYQNPIIYDVPVGYGRHLQWLSNKGYSLVGIDLDPEALNYIEDWKIQNNKINVEIIKTDIAEIEAVQVCDILINVDLYTRDILRVICNMVKTNGIILIETPKLIRGNFNNCPMECEVKETLIHFGYEIISYKESSPINGHVSVQAKAKRIKI